MNLPADHTPPATVTLRPASEADIDALLALEQRCFSGDRLSARSFVRLLSGDTAHIVVAEKLDIVGYALLLRRRNSRAARIYSLAIDPRHRQQGLAKKLLWQCEAYAMASGCTRLRLEVRRDNTAALALYQKLGYRLTGVKPNYYDDGEDGLRLEKLLAVGNRPQ